MTQQTAIFAVAAFAIGGMLVRPRGTPEALWTTIGAMALVLFGLVPLGAAWSSIAGGLDVYLFLAGMMVLAETARACGVFAWLASHTVAAGAGSRLRLFTIVYAACVGVTIFFSNDATAVVLTPAIAAVVARAKVAPLPYLYACAFVANAASFVLPISNPANLVVYADRLPALGRWVQTYGLASLASIALTYAVLFALSRRDLEGGIEDVDLEPLSAIGRRARILLALAAIALAAGSMAGVALGMLTASVAAAVALVLAASDRGLIVRALRGIDVPTLVLVAGLFAIVAAVERTDALAAARALYVDASRESAFAERLGIGAGVTLASNLMNNLPVGLAARYALHGTAHAQSELRATVVAVDLGPNVSLTGSLATLLWASALAKAGIAMNGRRFLRTGIVVTLPALAGALALLF